jgi:hypothetical protein
VCQCAEPNLLLYCWRWFWEKCMPWPAAFSVKVNPATTTTCIDLFQQLDQESDGDAKMILRQHVMIILQPILIVYVFLLFTDLICWFNIL